MIKKLLPITRKQPTKLTSEIMNESELFQIHQSRFKSWIKKRFIAETDINSMPSDVALAWAAALTELAREIQITALRIWLGKKRGGLKQSDLSVGQSKYSIKASPLFLFFASLRQAPHQIVPFQGGR
ncbi:MAG: hypothetical protein C6Y22_17470 [Hapalosiphonaceae cyanobacterium JJU2]|nr:MAG: hypothetical protein C6Y22_17470 [Hapalosiphonaceae cyanobacterium JJU2]